MSDLDLFNQYYNGYRIGIAEEQERILKLLNATRMYSCRPTCKTDINIYAFVLEELGVDLFKLIKENNE